MKPALPIYAPVFLAVAAVFVQFGCTPGAMDRRAAAKYPDPKVRFANYTKTCGGIPGNLPDHYGYYLTDEQKNGACTWYLWTGGDPLRTEGKPENARGNSRFWRMAEKRLWKDAQLLQLPINVNTLKYITGTPRGQRFKTLGTINDPGCKAPTKPDAYGLWLDDCEDPYSSGIMGIRLFPNPEFNPENWDANKYISHDSRIEPPYLAGLACGICHIAFNPAKPPADPENPSWENLAPAFGNQYLLEGKMFMGGLTDDNLLYWTYHTQQAGTSDTSRISTDFINNPNVINSIFYILSARPKHMEKMNDGAMQAVPHILKDGSDSIGAAGAALRVYVNIGTCPDYRYSLEDSFIGILDHQHPFDLNKAEKECVDWQLTKARMGDAANFLDAVQPYPLKNAPGGSDYLKATSEQMDLGMTVFAENCASCHSSKLPPELDQNKIEKHSDAAKPYWVKLVKSNDFLTKNFLSDDERYPLVSTDKKLDLETNAARAVGSNPIEGHLWQNFSSATFKALPVPGTMILQNPFSAKDPIKFKIPNGGYYRTPTLINAWATAPFLHNNMLGKYNGDPSVAGRMEAYNDAAEKLMWPQKRDGIKTMKVTTKVSYLQIRSIRVRIPEGTPVNLLANINFYRLTHVPGLLEEFVKFFNDPERLARLVKALRNEGQFDDDLKKMVPGLLALNQAPDFIEDHGHTFGSELKDDQKRALIEYMKTF